MQICDALRIKEKAFISLVGAGGKSTLFSRLAEELALKSKRVILTTTTKMFARQLNPFLKKGKLIEGQEEEIVQNCIRKYFSGENRSGQVVAIQNRKEEKGEEKLSGPPFNWLDRWWKEKLADYFLVEADGAAGRPIKAPASHEPVIPLSTTDLIGVVGIEAIGLPLQEENVFRSRIFSRLTGVKLGEKIGIEALTALICHPKGLFKNIPPDCKGHLFINKVDGKERHILANRLAYQVLQSCPERVQDIIIGAAIQNKDKVVIDLIRGRG